MTQPTNVVRLFFEGVDRFPDHAAFIEKHTSITYKQLAGKVLQTASYFMREGIKKGDRVLIFLPASIDLYRIVLALFYLGAVPVFLDEWVNKSRMELCCKLANCTAFIGSRRSQLLGWMFSSELRKVPIKLGTRFPAIPAYPPMSLMPLEDTALVTFSTGHTGLPIGAERSHALLMEQLRALKMEIRPDSEDISLTTLPISVLMNLSLGITTVIPVMPANQPEALKPKKLYDQLKQEGITRFSASPYVVRKVAEYMIHHNLRLPDLRQIITGGAPVFPEEALIYHTAFGETQVKILYGSEEVDPISSILGSDLAERTDQKLNEGLCVGMPFRGGQVRIIRMINAPIEAPTKADLQAISCRAGEIGEVIVQGPHVLQQYANHPEAWERNKIQVEGELWHRTGDAGYVGEDGKLYLTGRCWSMIQREERYFAPFLYEHYFQHMEGVDTGTILEADQGLLAIIELQKQSHRERVRRRLDHLELPYDRVVFLHKIPRQPKHQSKIDYTALREMLGES